MLTGQLVLTALQETANTVVSGTAAGTVAFTGSGAGTASDHVFVGIAAGTAAFTGSAAGTAADHVLVGAATGAVTFTGSATGAAARHLFSGTAAGSVAVTGAAIGHITEHGSGAASVTVTGFAAGTASHHVFVGAAAGVITISGTASGVASRHLATGSAASSVTFTGDAAGRIQTDGIGQSSFTVTGAALGIRGYIEHVADVRGSAIISSNDTVSFADFSGVRGVAAIRGRTQFNKPGSGSGAPAFIWSDGRIRIRLSSPSAKVPMYD